MVILSYLKKDLIKRSSNFIFQRKENVLSDIIITSNYKNMIRLAKKYKETLIIFITKRKYKNIPQNIFLYDKLDFLENTIIYNNIKSMSKSLKEKIFNKLKYKLKNEPTFKKVFYYFKKIGFSIKKYSLYENFYNYVKDNNFSILDDNKIFSNNKIIGFYLIKNNLVYFFEYLINEKSMFYKQIFNATIKFINEIQFFNKEANYNNNLKENEKFFASHIGEGFFIQNSSGKITFVNNILKKMLINYNINFNYLKSFFLNNYHNSTFKKDRTFTLNFETQNPIEGKHFFEINYSPIKNGDKVISYCAIIRDVSLQKRLEDALHISNSELERMNKILKTIQNATILGFSKLAEYKDKETAGHLDRIQNYVRALTKEIYLKGIFIDYKTKKNYITEEYIDELSFSSLLHDIGKMGVPDNILQKPSRLTTDEFVSMQLHTKIGGDTLKWLNDMVSEKTFLALAKEVAYYHHEKWNGKGYPFGLKEEHIPLSARIVGLCDVYDALTTKRSYKEPYSHEKACEIIYNNAGHQFDPAIISVFSSVEEEFKHIRNTFSA